MNINHQELNNNYNLIIDLKVEEVMNKMIFVFISISYDFNIFLLNILVNFVIGSAPVLISGTDLPCI